ncbi:hypothetical protein TPHA_0N00470 [Tetrapisispora phaffii CBS 4417]|uniref:Pre-mRNA-processing protein 45 n=1 Tax=Tetrapisispora phaffii (strain ATCC 24235 / CBS 4417 / NBRC 1672 / NRRL Y-8282 / UCD 70-5) TaxID=1071381 RepID=G8C0Z9_TETPH|nr:hypothetical protein TPHA_0N00470 [Tetrapisispora phaffii CBS 4417]CCE65827.1 hypothetical protein TPHA_0N00470 [Tetrapisispora phaffii CBS 4417]
MLLLSSLLPEPVNGARNKNVTTTKDKNSLNSRNARIVKELTEKKDVDKTDKSLIDDLFDINIRKGTTFSDFVPLRQNDFSVRAPMPTQQEINETFLRTKGVFEKILSGKTQNKSSTPLSSQQANRQSYEINYKSTAGDKNGKDRIVKIVQHAADPLQPNTIKAKKVVAPATEDNQTPIFHKTDAGNTEKKVLTKEERDQWNIPAAISSWKNPNGYTIALDKRLRLDARYNKDNTAPYEVNEKLTALSTALEDADRIARDELKQKAELKRKEAEKEIKSKEEKLKLLSAKAREHANLTRNSRYEGSSNDSKELEAERARTLIRKAKTQDIEKDIRTSKMSTSEKLRKLAYSQKRDISEKVILEAAKATKVEQVSYDSRLFSKGANAHSKRSEDQVYDNPLFAEQDIGSLYRPNLNELDKQIQDEDMLNRIKSTKTFDAASTNSGPIEFTEAENAGNKSKTKDNFGIQEKRKE